MDELSDRFGRLIASRVERLSRDPDLDEDIHLKRLHACDWQTRLIKLADAADDLEDDGEEIDGQEKEQRINNTEHVLDLAFGDEQPVLRAQRHLTELLQNARMAG